jgi:GTP-binding protein
MPPIRNKLFLEKCEFVAGVAKIATLPNRAWPEVAFAGRSNVGKSSLINALLGRELAHVSKTPGRTQQLNFFRLGEHAHLVDMPGYGYAKVSKTLKDDWNELIRLYLKGRVQLKAAFVLVDSRHGLKDTDHTILDLLAEHAVSARIVLTKADELKPQALSAMITQVEGDIKKYASAFPQVLAVSAREGTGLEDLRDVIAELLK